MKVIVDSPQFCIDHRDEVVPADGQLVIFNFCIECDPLKMTLQGVEDKAELEFAYVVDRPDLDAQTYSDAIVAAIFRSLHVDEQDIEEYQQFARRHAAYLLNVAEEFAEDWGVGTQVIRSGNDLVAEIPKGTKRRKAA